MDLLLDAICVVDAQGRFVFVSAAGERIFGYAPEDMIGLPMIDLVFHEDRSRTLHAVDEIVAGLHKPHFENRYVRKDGRIVHIMWSAHWSEADQMRVAVARDVTERKRAESMQAALYAIAEAAYGAEDLPGLFERIHRIVGGLLPAINFFVALYDRETEALTFPYYVDEHGQAPAPGKLDSGTLSAEVIRTGRAILLPRDAAAHPSERIHADVGAGAPEWLGVPLGTQQGMLGALVVKSYSHASRYGENDIELLQFVSAQVAATIERKQMETALLHSARHDSLTGLPNRELLHDRLRTALSRARRDRSRLSVLYVDLDTFKQVNDGLGHAVGDLVLQEVAARLKHCVRESDTVSRVGGDEFVILLNGIHSPECASLIAEKAHLVLGKPFDVAGHRLHIAASIGISLYPEHGDDDTQLIRHADEAMYKAKRDGGNRIWMTTGA